MENEQDTTKFEKYSQWFEKIIQMCKDDNFINQVSFQQNSSYSGFKHYIIGNGLHVYINSENTIISDKEIVNPWVARKMQLCCGKKSYIIYTLDDEIGRIKYVQQVEPEVEIAEGKAEGTVTRLTEGKIEEVTEKELNGEWKDYSLLPTELNVRSKKIYDLQTDIEQSLTSAMEGTSDKKLKTMYSEAISLYQKIKQVVLKDRIMGEGLEKTGRVVYNKTNPTPLITEDDLRSLNLDELREELRKIQESNSLKEEELNKQQIINKILEAQQENIRLISEFDKFLPKCTYIPSTLSLDDLEKKDLASLNIILSSLESDNEQKKEELKRLEEEDIKRKIIEEQTEAERLKCAIAAAKLRNFQYSD